ncbi:unnamed protein product [marine sediment metagenome]|uniref:Uncharacterized protein n=1 Tax=marine sediment metagenome TaxID=412755 RepID=X1MAY0_9ZZZZ
MVKKGDTIYDVQKYVEFRMHHLKLEGEKVPFVVEKSKIEQAKQKLKAKCQELRRLKKVLNGDIKEHSKSEWREVRHLEKMKIDALKNRQK